MKFSQANKIVGELLNLYAGQPAQTDWLRTFRLNHLVEANEMMRIDAERTGQEPGSIPDQDLAAIYVALHATPTFEKEVVWVDNSLVYVLDEQEIEEESAKRKQALASIQDL